MRFTFLGTGTSQGVPVITCKCAVCTSSNVKDKRLRTSLMVQSDTTTVVIDTGPDFRQQMLQNKVQDVDAVLFTHGHKDHIAGLDDIRPFNYLLEKEIDIYAETIVQEALKREFQYAFEPQQYPGVPLINLITIDETPFAINDIDVIPIRAMHKSLPVLGFRFDDFTYITDANFIAESELEKMYDTEVLVINALRKEAHYSHFSLDEAIAIAQKVNAKQTFFTHISHHMGLHDEVNLTLPKNMYLAYDGLVL